MAQHNDFGEWGELVAADYLKANNYFVKYHDWRIGHRDIDIVAIDNNTKELVFVEVKTRRNTLFALPEQSIDRDKALNLQSAIRAFLTINKPERKFRFDIITVVGTDDTNVEINHMKNCNLL